MEDFKINENERMKITSKIEQEIELQMEQNDGRIVTENEDKNGFQKLQNETRQQLLKNNQKNISKNSLKNTTKNSRKNSKNLKMTLQSHLIVI